MCQGILREQGILGEGMKPGRLYKLKLCCDFVVVGGIRHTIRLEKGTLVTCLTAVSPGTYTFMTSDIICTVNLDSHRWLFKEIES